MRNQQHAIITALSLSALWLFTSTALGQETALDAERIRNTVMLDEIAASNLGLETALADERDFESTVFAVGRIEEIPAHRYAISSRIAGRAVEILAFEGDHVAAGQIVAQVESRQPGNPPPTIALRSPVDGLVVASHTLPGKPVEPDTDVMDIADRSRMWAVARIPEQDAARMKTGALARIRIPALGEEILEARLSRFGVEADRQAGTVSGVFELPNPDDRLVPGMRAEFSIVWSSRKNVLSVPRAAVQGDPARRVVFVKDFELPHAYLKAPVVLGERNDLYVEVVRGLFPGDDVVTKGSYALGFVGGDGGVSLKEALDAAHGHAHNEDGSEITPDASASGAHDAHGEHAHEAGAASWLKMYALAITILAAVLGFRGARKRQGGAGC